MVAPANAVAGRTGGNISPGQGAVSSTLPRLAEEEDHPRSPPRTPVAGEGGYVRRKFPGDAYVQDRNGELIGKGGGARFFERLGSRGRQVDADSRMERANPEYHEGKDGMMQEIDWESAINVRRSTWSYEKRPASRRSWPFSMRPVWGLPLAGMAIKCWPNWNGSCRSLGPRRHRRSHGTVTAKEPFPAKGPFVFQFEP